MSFVPQLLREGKLKKNISARLARYEEIASGKQLPRYLIAKEVKCDFRLSDETDDLWQLHDELVAGMKNKTESSGSSNLLQLKAELADRILSKCNLCERKCDADRKHGEKGKCGVLEARISSEFIHMGEEPEIIPSYTIFFSGCTFKCVFCQNWDISTHPEAGRIISSHDLAKMIEDKDTILQQQSKRTRDIYDSFPFRRPSFAKNVNWVGGEPTSNLPFILKTLAACDSRLPQVWNSNMYLTKDSMKLLDGIIDLYLTDFKYGNDNCAKRLSGIDNYFEVIARNHSIATNQCDALVRHLVLPNHIECCTRPILEWIERHTSDVVVNIMAQYRPEHRADEFKDISKPLTNQEFCKALKIGEDLGLNLTS